MSNMHPIWESKYSKGHRQLYPWDVVVGFVFKNFLNKKPKKNIHILELGFGTGSNLWFAAREGFSVFGIEGSKTAVSIAKRRLKLEKLSGDLRLGDFTKLPFKSDFFDLVIDRNSLCCVGNLAQKKTIDETNRVLKKKGKFLHCTYGKNHSSYKSGKTTRDGLTKKIKKGSLIGLGHINFSSRLDIYKKFSNGWKIIQFQKRDYKEIKKKSDLHQEWIVVVEKK